LFFIFLAFSAPAWSQRSIVVYGDSLSAAYGIARARGWVALLEERLKREQIQIQIQIHYSVVNASVSGETTSGALARMQAVLERHRPSIVILELGANDGLRGMPVAQMSKNLAAMIEHSRKAGAQVLVVGMKLPPNYGPDYTQAFEASFSELAKRYHTSLVPFLLEDFATRPELFQSDRIHPTEEAQPLMLERVWNALRPMLR
jgi:acyl-CoA thioesterase I